MPPQEKSVVTIETEAGRTWKTRFSALSLLVPHAADPATEDKSGTNDRFHDSLDKLFRGNVCSKGSADSFSAENAHALTALERLEVTVDGICLFLRDNGVDEDSLEELYEMELRLEYTSLLKKAEEYTEDILLFEESSGLLLKEDDENILDLFLLAWTSFEEYSQDRYKQIHQRYSNHQLQHWQEQVTRISNEQYEDDGPHYWRRQDRHKKQGRQDMHKDLLEKMACPEEEASLREQLAQSIQFKMQCHKNLILTQEWSRCLQRQLKQRGGMEESQRSISCEC